MSSAVLLLDFLGFHATEYDAWKRNHMRISVKIISLHFIACLCDNRSTAAAAGTDERQHGTYHRTRKEVKARKMTFFGCVATSKP